MYPRNMSFQHRYHTGFKIRSNINLQQKDQHLFVWSAASFPELRSRLMQPTTDMASMRSVPSCWAFVWAFDGMHMSKICENTEHDLLSLDPRVLTLIGAWETLSNPFAPYLIWNIDTPSSEWLLATG